MSIAPEDVQPSFNDNARKYRCCFGFCCHVRIFAKIIAALELVSASCAFVSALIAYSLYRATKPNSYQHALSVPSSAIGGGGGNETRLNSSSATVWTTTTTTTTTTLGRTTTMMMNNGGLRKGPPSPLPTPTPEAAAAASANIYQEVHFAANAFIYAIVIVAAVLLYYGIAKHRSRCLLPHLFVQLLSMIGLLIVAIVYALPNTKLELIARMPRPLIVAVLIGAFIVQCFAFGCVFRCYRYVAEKRRSLPCSAASDSRRNAATATEKSEYIAA